MGPMVSEMKLNIDCDYIGQPDNTKITIHWCCHMQLDPYIEQLESFKTIDFEENWEAKIHLYHKLKELLEYKPTTLSKA